MLVAMLLAPLVQATSKLPVVCSIIMEPMAASSNPDLRFIADTLGRTPIHYAAAIDDSSDTVQIFLNAKCDLTATDSFGMSPLHLACLNGNERSLSWIMDGIVAPGELATHINGQDLLARTPLHYASLNGHPGIVRILLMAKGIKCDNPDIRLQTPLCLAIANGSEPSCDCIEQLLEKGANRENRDENGLTPLMTAAFGNNVAAVDLLAGNGYDSDEDNSDDEGEAAKIGTSLCTSSSTCLRVVFCGPESADWGGL